MTDTLSNDALAVAFSVLTAEGLPADLITALTVAMGQATRNTQHATEVFTVDGHSIAERSMHGSLTFFLPPPLSHSVPQRLATFDRRGRLLLLLYRDAAGNLMRFKARGLDGRFLGVERGAASHLGWG